MTRKFKPFQDVQAVQVVKNECSRIWKSLNGLFLFEVRF